MVPFILLRSTRTPYKDPADSLSTSQLITGWIQTIYYGITIRAGDPKPQPGTPRYVKHRRRIHITVVIVYLLYTIYEADYWIRQQSDFYQNLGVTFDADEKKIKSRFRRLYDFLHMLKNETARTKLNLLERQYITQIKWLRRKTALLPKTFS